MIVAGLVSAGVISPWADRHRHHVKLLCKILIPTAVVLLIGFMFSIRRNAFVPLIVFSALLGAVAFSMLGIGVELGVEVTYPATPASTSAILWAFAQLLSALFILILESLLNLNQDMSVNRSTLNPPLIFLIVWCVVFGVIPVMLIQAPYRRMEAEDKMRQEMEAASMPEQGAGQLRDVERGIEMSSTESSRSKSGDKEELV
ncbi:hypothetical protein BGW38_003108 [Lunasporangiospora selenospora]|uniref:Uncharacterized protein n=1 Tax=Lunasporangiospora selenospora TaxID=979761 RepID=A0A9P6FRN3_9FUNG|nr:hypothetical protein BGW38_003108 [Lunasporangiospora selenospora]